MDNKWNVVGTLTDDQWTDNEGFCTKKHKTKQKFDSLSIWTWDQHFSHLILLIFICDCKIFIL